MSDDFKADRLRNEKSDPVEAASPRFVFVPVILISMFIGFGATYLAFTTKTTGVETGDGRGTTPARTAPLSSGAYAKGKQVFTTVCQACHQASGLGIPGAFPPLAGSEWVLGPPRRLAAIILHGAAGEIVVKGQTFRGAMPAQKGALTDEQIADVATYVRGSWGNSAAAVETSLVTEVREKTKARATPWNGGEELGKTSFE